MTELERLIEELTEEEKSVMRNLIAPAVMLAGDESVEIVTAGSLLLESVEHMLRARVNWLAVVTRIEEHDA